LFIDPVLYRYRVGIPWRGLPERFADFRVMHLRHSRWSKSDVWERIFKILSQNSDNKYVMSSSALGD
jgi:transposase